MRIISGKHRGKRLVAPKNLPTRPTTDRAKESLFNILNNTYAFDSITVIDLFAGIGSISFEFASRGSNKVYAIDQHFGCVKFIEQTAKVLACNIRVYKKEVYAFLENTTLQADIIFADPPYHFEKSAFLRIASLVFKKNLLHKNGTLIIEHSKHTDLSEHPQFDNVRKYGNNNFSFFCIAN